MQVRYGAAALEDGYVAIPQVVLHYRRALGITAGEWDYLCEIFRYWRSAADPYPGVETLAAGLECDPSTIRRYRLSLEGKGLLRVYREDNHNHYDLAPLLDAAVGLARREQQMPPAPCTAAPAPRLKLHAKEEDRKEEQDYDRTPTPQAVSAPEPQTVLAAVLPPLLEGIAQEQVHGKADAEKHVLVARLAPISAEFGDDSPASSVTRALHLRAELGVSPERFLDAIDHAAGRVRETAPTFSILGASGRPQGIHYFFGVLKRELCGVTVRARERRPGPRQHVVADYSAIRPAPAPIEESHPTWRAVLEALQPVLTAVNYDRWFAPTRALAQEGMVLRVAVPDLFTKDWLEKKLGQRVAETLRRVGQGDVRVEYVVVEAA